MLETRSSRCINCPVPNELEKYGLMLGANCKGAVILAGDEIISKCTEVYSNEELLTSEVLKVAEPGDKMCRNRLLAQLIIEKELQRSN